jgi:putative salt-induced outer membrane protein YdiY
MQPKAHPPFSLGRSKGPSPAFTAVLRVQQLRGLGAALAGLGVLTALIALPASPAAADQLELTNGDRLTGTAVRLAAGELLFHTGWAGELKIAWKAVASLVTDEPLTVVLEDGSRLTGSAVGGDGTILELASEPAGRPPVPVELARIAAINPEETPPVVWDGNVNLSLVSTRGNTDTDNRLVDGELSARTARHRTTLRGTSQETKDHGRKTASRTTLSLGWDRFFDSPWYFATSARLSEDEFQDLSLRTSLGAAAGYRFRDDPTHRLSLELGASYVDEDFVSGPDDSYAAVRWALDFTWPVFAPGVRVFHHQEGLLGLSEGNSLLLATQSGLRFTLFGSFLATTQLNFDYDDSPAPGREKDDTTFLISLGYEW